MGKNSVKKIGVFIADISMDVGGVFVYANGLINMLISDERLERLVIFHSVKQTEHVLKMAQRSDRISLILVDVQNNPWQSFWVKLYNFCDKFYAVFETIGLGRKFLKSLTQWMNPYRKLFEGAGVDLVHVPYQVPPITGIAVPVVITMHDVQELVFPQYFTSRERMRRSILYKSAIEKCDHIIVSMEHIKLDILKYFNIPEGKVSICPLPFAQEWFEDTIPPAASILTEKYGLQNPFILYPAMTWEHKNHQGLIQALHLLKTQGAHVQLICTGKKTDYFSKINHLVKELGLEDQVSFLGLVPEQDLIGLYKMTTLVVIPTFYEAESQPFFEAMRFESHVICSNVTSLPDSIGEVEFTFNPHQAKEMAALIKKGCFDQPFRQRNIDNLRRRKLYYQNMNASDAFFNAYESDKVHDET